MTLPQNQEAMPPEMKRCFNCGRKAIGESGSGLPLCHNHFDIAIVAGWKPRLYIPAPPDPVSESRIAEIRELLEESPNLGREWLKKACIDLLAELDRRKEQR